MSESPALRLQVNGKTHSVEASADTTLLSLLRDQLQLTAAKRGCNQGVCGACTVRIDGWPMRACLTLAHGCAENSITTLEGLGNDARMQVLQRAFVEAGAFQCGFCTPGMLMTAHALLSQQPTLSAEDVRSALSGNLCRCTGYNKIIEAVLGAARSLQVVVST